MRIYNHITSKENSRLKQVVKLATDAGLRKSLGLSVAYGEHLVIEAAKYDLIQEVFVEETSLHLVPSTLKDSLTIHSLPAQLMQKINILESSVKIVAIIQVAPEELNAQCYAQDSLLLEEVQDPGNLGTILRAAQASGIRQVLLSPRSVDVTNPKVLRATQGLHFGLKIYTDIDLAQFVANYQGAVYALVANHGKSLYTADLTQTSALVFGNEGRGLSTNLLAHIEQKLTIPMAGKVESLNLAMAATITMFEMSRQRQVI